MSCSVNSFLALPSVKKCTFSIFPDEFVCDLLYRGLLSSPEAARGRLGLGSMFCCSTDFRWDNAALCCKYLLVGRSSASSMYSLCCAIDACFGLWISRGKILFPRFQSSSLGRVPWRSVFIVLDFSSFSNCAISDCWSSSIPLLLLLSISITSCLLLIDLFFSSREAGGGTGVKAFSTKKPRS